MAVTVPTFEEIKTRVHQDFEASLGTPAGQLGVVERSLAWALAAASYLLHIAIARAVRNKVPTTAEGWVARLWAAFFGVSSKTATKHVGIAAFPALAGTSIVAGTTIRTRGGTELVVDETASVSSGTITVPFTAAKTGAAGRSDPGTPVFLGSPVPGVTSEGVATDGISGGVDDESTAAVRGRLLERLRNPPRGGTDADWIRWTKETPGVNVADVWIRPNVPPYLGGEVHGLGASSVLVLFTVKAPNPIPTLPEEDAVTAYLQAFKPTELRIVVAKGPTAHPIDPVIALSPNTGTVRLAVEASLRAMLARDAVPGGTVLLSRIHEAISTAEGESDHVLTSPTENVVAPSRFHLVTLGTPDFTTL